MPIHDWKRVDAGLFHDFHQGWTISLRNALNSGALPPEYFALVDQNVQGPIPDILTLRLAADADHPSDPGGGVAVAEAPPQARLIRKTEAEIYASRANRISVRHRHGDVVAAIEIVSPGNKGSRADVRAFVEKSARIVQQGVHLLVIDLFPPTKRDPHGLARAVWEEFLEEDLSLPQDKPLMVASIDAGPEREVYYEPLGIGDVIPDMPLFLRPGIYVPAPLESSYQLTWDMFPKALKGLLEPSTNGRESP